MAEFLNQKPRPSDAVVSEAFAAMGKPIPAFRKQNGLEHGRQMGLDTDKSFACVQAMSEQLARDEPYMAMEAGMRFLDLTGVYRMMAVLLTGDPPKEPEPTYWRFD